MILETYTKFDEEQFNLLSARVEVEDKTKLFFTCNARTWADLVYAEFFFGHVTPEAVLEKVTGEGLVGTILDIPIYTDAYRVPAQQDFPDGLILNLKD